MTTDEGPSPLIRRVLLIEDNPDGRESLCTLLTLAGFQVETAADGRQGVEKALSWQPDTAIVDIGLPLLDGYEVAACIRKALGGTVHLIAVTAYSPEQARTEAIRAGFNHFRTKPADPDELLELVLQSYPFGVR